MNLTFETLKLDVPLHPTTYDALRKLGFKKPTPVQAMCIPLILSRKDVVAEAVTGSGKTVAFLVPVIETLLRREKPLTKEQIGAVILTPTRELALQISKVLGAFTATAGLSQLLLIGGKPLVESIEQFQKHGGQIVVATPGKLRALFADDKIDVKSAVKSLEILILDEADRILSNENFERELHEIFRYLPKQRRTSLFSATQTDKVESFIRAGLRNPVQVTVREKQKTAEQASRTPDTLTNYFLLTEAKDKVKKLVCFLRMHREKKNIVFFNTCASVDYFSKLLTMLLKTIPVISIHGNMRGKRNRMFEKFHSMEKGVLMCTDLMARGVDIPDVDWVVQFDPPSDAESFVHRCGRTARMGSRGSAVIFLLPNELAYVDFVRINQQCMLSEFCQLPDDIPDMTMKVRKTILRDRELYEKGLRAFVSFTQCYVKHKCNVIFQFGELNIGGVATAFGLLHLPKMPELKNAKVVDFKKHECNYAKIGYKDKTREKRRLEKLEEDKNKEKVVFKKTVKWSRQKEKSEKKKVRKEKQTLKRKLKDENDDNEVGDLMREGRLLKKLKNKKISDKQFDKIVGESAEME